MNIRTEHIQVLGVYVENIKELVSNGDVQEVLNAIDDVIVDNILGHNEEPDKVGIMLQKLYDEIFYLN